MSCVVGKTFAGVGLPAATLMAAMLMVAGVAVAGSTPGVGDEASDFSLPSMRGGEARLSDVAAKGPVVLLVLRGFPGYQCPICNRQVQDFISHAEGFAGAGASVLMVYPGPADGLEGKAREFIGEKTLPENFDVLLDPGYTFTNLYGLRWDAPRETAYPSTFLIDKARKVFFARVSKTHGGRTKAAEVVELLSPR